MPAAPPLCPFRPGAFVSTAALLAALTGCGGVADADRHDRAEDARVAMDNCGTEVSVDAPPERVVTMNQHATEVMLALGLQDRLVGTAFLDDAVLPAYQDAYDAVPVLADQYPSFEKLLEADPDFVYAGYGESAFDPSEGRGRSALADVGIETYTNIEQCTDDVTMDTVAAELRNIGAVFGVEERAEELIAGIEDDLGDVHTALDGAEPVDVLVADTIGTSVLTAGGSGISSDIIERAGGVNVFDDVEDTFADVSIEQAAARSPEAVLIYDYGATSVEEKKQALLNDPLLSETPAVENERFAVLPLSSAVVGIRVGDAVTGVAEQLHPEKA